MTGVELSMILLRKLGLAMSTLPLSRQYPPVCRQIELQVDMLLWVTKSHLLEKPEGRQIVSLRVDEEHANTTFLHEISKAIEEPFCNVFSLKIWIHSKPYQVTIFPGRMVLDDCRSQNESDDLPIQLSHQTELWISLINGNDLKGIPGPIEIGNLLSPKKPLTQMKNSGEVVYLHLTDLKIRVLLLCCRIFWLLHR